MKAAAIVLSAAVVFAAAPAYAQLGGALGKIKKGADQAADAKKKYDEILTRHADPPPPDGGKGAPLLSAPGDRHP